ncbi:Hypothetical protein P9303_06911 [Prochlorococcus marinus str. MIT 9303]|uniref:Uncharacterized protein n=1 Tax=Prochlorococcus marinus (strain MIT 9303) TaxID=59922 RepID=A2C7I2_PROM3|nr:Hypothetical protein P9303_06911 [Prochlorococcus marinus str. MIT 9303]
MEMVGTLEQGGLNGPSRSNKEKKSHPQGPASSASFFVASHDLDPAARDGWDGCSA